MFCFEDNSSKVASPAHLAPRPWGFDFTDNKTMAPTSRSSASADPARRLSRPLAAPCSRDRSAAAGKRGGSATGRFMATRAGRGNEIAALAAEASPASCNGGPEACARPSTYACGIVCAGQYCLTRLRGCVMSETTFRAAATRPTTSALRRRPDEPDRRRISVGEASCCCSTRPRRASRCPRRCRPDPCDRPIRSTAGYPAEWKARLAGLAELTRLVTPVTPNASVHQQYMAAMRTGAPSSSPIWCCSCSCGAGALVHRQTPSWRT